ncbi:hypothetical protein DCAR_0831144 [Daucus carota subsp. sativus]|uniref:Uncharacterized protein n=1 Tax=Daucus carota subsp. sativus TaxID=79200 RepID=A0A175YM19_DAUCS|nr:hypothetical protein DCAR_0831144 [Daucus carota subsp. sativus]
MHIHTCAGTEDEETLWRRDCKGEATVNLGRMRSIWVAYNGGESISKEEDEGHVDAGEGDIDGGQGDLDVGEDDLVGGEGYLDVAEDAFDSEDSEDPDYQAEEVTESETDEELVDARKARKEKGDESDSEYAEGDYNSEELRTDASSSDDENLKQDYVGIALVKGVVKHLAKKGMSILCFQSVLLSA